MIARVVAIEWRGKIDDPKWRRGATSASPPGPGCRPSCGAWRSRSWSRGLPVGPDKNVVGPVGHRRAQPLHAARRAGHLRAVPVPRRGVPGAEDRRRGAHRRGRDWRPLLSVPATVLVAAFGLWTQLAYGKPWTWAVLGVAVRRATGGRRLAARWRPRGLGVPGTTLVVAAVVILLFGVAVPESGALDHRPGLQPDDLQRLLEPVHLEGDDLGRSRFSPRSCWSTRAGRTGCSASGSSPSRSRQSIGLPLRRVP